MKTNKNVNSTSRLHMWQVPVPSLLFASINFCSSFTFTAVCRYEPLELGVYPRCPGVAWNILIIQPGFVHDTGCVISVLCSTVQDQAGTACSDDPCAVERCLDFLISHSFLCCLKYKEADLVFSHPWNRRTNEQFSKEHRLYMQRSSMQILTCLCLGLCIQKAV